MNLFIFIFCKISKCTSNSWSFHNGTGNQEQIPRTQNMTWGISLDQFSNYHVDVSEYFQDIYEENGLQKDHFEPNVSFKQITRGEVDVSDYFKAINTNVYPEKIEYQNDYSKTYDNIENTVSLSEFFENNTEECQNDYSKTYDNIENTVSLSEFFENNTEEYQNDYSKTYDNIENTVSLSEFFENNTEDYALQRADDHIKTTFTMPFQDHNSNVSEYIGDGMRDNQLKENDLEAQSKFIHHNEIGNNTSKFEDNVLRNIQTELNDNPIDVFLVQTNNNDLDSTWYFQETIHGSEFSGSINSEIFSSHKHRSISLQNTRKNKEISIDSSNDHIIPKKIARVKPNISRQSSYNLIDVLDCSDESESQNSTSRNNSRSQTEQENNEFTMKPLDNPDDQLVVENNQRDNGENQFESNNIDSVNSILFVRNLTQFHSNAYHTFEPYPLNSIFESQNLIDNIKNKEMENSRADDSHLIVKNDCAAIPDQIDYPTRFHDISKSQNINSEMKKEMQKIQSNDSKKSSMSKNLPCTSKYISKIIEFGDNVNLFFQQSTYSTTECNQPFQKDNINMTLEQTLNQPIDQSLQNCGKSKDLHFNYCDDIFSETDNKESCSKKDFSNNDIQNNESSAEYDSILKCNQGRINLNISKNTTEETNAVNQQCEAEDDDNIVIDDKEEYIPSKKAVNDIDEKDHDSNLEIGLQIHKCSSKCDQNDSKKTINVIEEEQDFRNQKNESKVIESVVGCDSEQSESKNNIPYMQEQDLDDTTNKEDDEFFIFCTQDDEMKSDCSEKEDLSNIATQTEEVESDLEIHFVEEENSSDYEIVDENHEESFLFSNNDKIEQDFEIHFVEEENDQIESKIKFMEEEQIHEHEIDTQKTEFQSMCNKNEASSSESSKHSEQNSEFNIEFENGESSLANNSDDKIQSQVCGSNDQIQLQVGNSDDEIQSHVCISKDIIQAKTCNFEDDIESKITIEDGTENQISKDDTKTDCKRHHSLRSRRKVKAQAEMPKREDEDLFYQQKKVQANHYKLCVGFFFHNQTPSFTEQMFLSSVHCEKRYDTRNLWLLFYPRIKCFGVTYLTFDSMFNDFKHVCDTLISTYKITTKCAQFLSILYKENSLPRKLILNYKQEIHSTLNCHASDLDYLKTILINTHKGNLKLLFNVLKNKPGYRDHTFFEKILSKYVDSEDFNKWYRLISKRQYEPLNDVIKPAKMALDTPNLIKEDLFGNSLQEQIDKDIFGTINHLSRNANKLTSSSNDDMAVNQNSQIEQHSENNKSNNTEKITKELPSGIDHTSLNTIKIKNKNGNILSNCDEIIAQYSLTNDNIFSSFLFIENSKTEFFLDRSIAYAKKYLKERKISLKKMNITNTHGNIPGIFQNVIQDIIQTYLKYLKRIFIDNNRFSCFIHSLQCNLDNFEREEFEKCYNSSHIQS